VFIRAGNEWSDLAHCSQTTINNRRGHTVERRIMEIIYNRVGDYLLPNVKLSDPPDAPPLGRYGMLHKRYLKAYKPALYAALLLSERLYPLCREIDEAAETRLRTIPGWEQAHEIVLAEIVYC